MASSGSYSAQPMIQSKAEADDGSATAAARREQAHRMYAALFVLYVFGGMLVYYFLEGFDILESLIFILSILTGVGYGHLVPASSAGMIFTSVYILAGLVLFASIAGQILDFIMSSEINAVMDAMKASSEGQTDIDTSYKNSQKLDKRHQFHVGCINLAVMSMIAILLYHFAFDEDLVNAIYLASVSVLKLDSACLLDKVECSHGWHTSSGGSPVWLLFAAFWYVVTYGIIGHFLVSASNLLGVDPEASVSRVKRLSHERLQRMDNDGDGRVDKCEFLRDRLIQDGLCDKEAIDSILRNFDKLDKDKSGHLNHHDVGQP